MEHKPVEYRKLYYPSSQMSQGVVRGWLEIIPQQKLSNTRTWDITPKPPVDLQVRICILNAKDIPMKDVVGTCDCYFKGFFDSNGDVQTTDTHLRNKDGRPDFQYRMIFNVKHPQGDNKVTFQAFDRDLITYNDLIGETQVDLKQIMEDVSILDQPLPLNKNYYTRILSKMENHDELEFD